MKKLSFSLGLGILLILLNPHTAQGMKIEWDETRSQVLALMQILAQAGGEADSNSFQGTCLPRDGEMADGSHWRGLSCEETITCSVSDFLDHAFSNSSLSTRLTERWGKIYPFGSHSVQLQVTWHSSAFCDPYQPGSSAGSVSTVDVTGTLYATLVPTEENEKMGDEVLLYLDVYVNPGNAYFEGSRNSTVELEVDQLYLRIGEKTLGPYELHQHCHPCEVHTTLPPWVYPRSIGSKDMEEQTITARLGDTIEFFHHMKAEIHTVNSGSISDWSDRVEVRIELALSKLPWILIHGWDSKPEKWEKFEEFLQEDNIPCRPVNLTNPSRDEPPPADIARICPPIPETCPDIRGRRLAAEIDKFRPYLGFGKLKLIAHSQGGLDARAYIRDLGDTAKDKIHSLVMIGTPNHGTIGATIRDLYYKLTLRPDERTPWLTPGEVEIFNQRTPFAEGIEYYTVAGSKFVFPGSWLIPGADDGVVPVKSVRLDGATVLGPSTGENTFPYDHNDIAKEKDVYEAIKLNIDPAASQEPNLLAFIAIEDGEVLPEQSVSQSVIVDDVNEVAFVLISGGPLSLTLQSPSGEYIMPQTSNPDASFDSGQWLDLMAEGYIIHEPVAGVWQAHISTVTEPNHFIFLVSAENTLILDGRVDEQSNLMGGEVKLRATLDADVSITDMQADVTYPYGWREIITLYDDGLHEDDSPNDGIYGNVFSPYINGEYTIVFSAEGIVDGRSFSRADIESIVVTVSSEP